MTNKKKLALICFFLFVIITGLQSIPALTANSSSYSVNLFGAGMATATPSSTNYNSIALSETKGTTRNGNSDSYSTNIGFFNNVFTHQTVSITSYSISPTSAVVGSTIGLYISALNSESVWAEITSPNGQEQILSLIDKQNVNYIPSPSVVGTYQVIFYANSSTGAIASVIDSFELVEQTTTQPSGSGGSSGGGGGGTTTIIETCTYNWDCTPWNVCSDGKQKRICKNIGTCEGVESKPIEEIECSEALFDITLKLENIELTESQILKFRVDLIEKMGVEKIDAHIKYSIIDKDNSEIFSQIETRAIQKELSYEKEIKEIKLLDGDYTLRVDVLYGNLQRAFAEQKIIIVENKIRFTGLVLENSENTASLINYKNILALAALVILNFMLIFRKDSKLKKYNKKFKNKKRYLTIIALNLLTMVFLALILNPTITGNTINNSSYDSKLILVPFVIIFLIIFLYIFRKKFISIYESLIGLLPKGTRSNDKGSIKSIKKLIKKKVYTEEGKYFGEVKDVILGKNKIDSLKIKLQKNKKTKIKGIIVNYKHVKGVGHIIIVDNKISKSFN